MADESPTTPKASQQSHLQGQGGPSFRLNVQNETPAISEVLEATAAPVRGFARPGRRGASGGSSRSSNERRAAGSLSPIPAAAGVMSPILSPGAGGGERTQRPTSPSGTSTGTGSRGSSPLTLSSRSQSMLRAPHPFDEDPSLAIEGEGVVPSTDDPEIYARMFTAMQSKHETELKALQENILGLESEVAKLTKKEEDKDRYIIWAEDHTSNLERQVEQLGKENRILVDQVRAGQRSVRDLEIEIRRRENEARVYIRDREGEEPLSPESANERFRQLREEIRDLKEERYAQNEEMEVLFEKKEKYEELQEEHQTLKETVKTLEKELEVVREKAATPKIGAGLLKRMSTMGSTSTGGVEEGGDVKRASTISSTGGGVGFEPKELMRTETELEDIATLGQLITEKDETIMRLGQRIQDKDEHIAKLEGSIAAKEEQITKLKVDVRKAQDKNGALAEEVESKKEGYEKGLERARQQVGQLEQKLAAREQALAQEKERHDAVESRLASDKRDLQARLEEVDESDKKEVEDLAREIQEKEDEIAKLKQERQELEQKREEMAEQNRNLQQTARTVRKWQWDQPILQTIANTQLWSEKNIMKNALDSIKNRVKRIEPEQLEQAVQLIGDAKQSLKALPGDDKARQALVQQLNDVQQVLETRIQPLKAITQEVNATKDRLRKEKDDWAKEDAEITAVLRRIEGRGGAAREHRRRHSEHIAPPTEFMKRIETFEEEQNTYITTKHDEYAAIQAERPLGAPLTLEEDKRLHALTREFVNRLPENPMVAFLSRETPQARRRNQLWALTEKVKRLKIRDEKGKGPAQQDIHAWLPKLKPMTMEHKRRHALLVKELLGLEEQVEDLVQEINELAAPPDIEEERGRSFSRDDTSSPLSHPQSSKKPAPRNPDRIRRKEEKLRNKEDALRREIRFAHARLERLLYNRQLFEHWTENLEKRLNSEAAALVTQVLLEFELQTILDKESKEACFCSLLEYFFPRAYDFSVRGTGTVARHGHGRDHGTTTRKLLGPVVEEEGKSPLPQSGKALPKSAVPLGLGRSETLDLDASKKSPALPEHKAHKHGWMGRKRVTTPVKEDDGEAIKRSRAAPPESLRARFSQDDPAAPGSSQLERASTIYEGAGPSTANPFKRRSVTFESRDKDITVRDQHHGHGGGHVTINPTAQWLRENAYPVFCQVMTSLIWFVLLLAIQPVNLFWTFSFLLFAAGLPFYLLLQVFRFFLVEKKTSRDLLEKIRRTDDDASEEKVVKDQWQSPTGGVDVFEGTPLEGPGLGILRPAEPPRVVSGDVGESSSSAGPGTSSKGKGKEPDVGLRGGVGRPPKWRIKEGLTVQEQYEYESGSDDRPEMEDEERLRTPSPAQGELPGPFVTVQKKGKAKEYVVSDVENSDEEGYGSKRKPRELDEPQQTRPTPETSPSRSKPTRKGKEKEELTPQQLEEIGQASRRGRDSQQETSETQRLSRNKRTLSEEARWNTEQMLANALARKQEEDEAKLARRRQWLWWRVWYWVMRVLASAWQFVASRWPSSLWRRKSKATEGPVIPPQPSPARTPLREGSPSWWDRWSATSARSTPLTKSASGGGDVPDITVTTATPVEPRGQDGPLEDEKKKNTKPPFWSQWLASLRSFIDTLIVQKIPLLSFTIRSFLQSSLATLKSLLDRLLSLPKQLFSPISTSLGPLLDRLLAVPKRLFSSIVPSGASLQKVLNYPSRAFQSIRSKVPEVHIPRPNFHTPQLPSVPQLRNKVNLSLPNLPRPNLKLPEINRLKFVPRPPSPPTILGSLLSLLVIYTLLTYLAVVAERRVWTSSDTTWRHAYLRDLELSRGPPISVSHQQQQQQKVGRLASFFSSSSPTTPRRSDVYAHTVNTAYPGWSPLKADYRLIYAPAWYKIRYAPSDFISWTSYKTSQAWNRASYHSQQTWDSFTQIISALKDSIPRSPHQARETAQTIWSEIKHLFIPRIIHLGRVGAVEIPSRISQLFGWIQRRAKYSLDTVHQQRRDIKGFLEQVFIDREILVPGTGGGKEGAVVEVPSLLTTWRRKVGYYLVDLYDFYVFGFGRWFVRFVEDVADTFTLVGEWLSPPFTWIGETLAEWWDKVVDLEGGFWDFLAVWGRRIPGVGLLDFWATHLGVRAGEILGSTWEAVKGRVLWVFEGPVGVYNWVSDVLWKFQIFGTVLARRYVYPWGFWVEGVWRTVKGYGRDLGRWLG
ncbi:hypothetical protein V8F33_008392 [Rhypophila sp. PSN 637]